MSVPFRPITRLVELLAELGLEVSYAYEDLVFVEHNAFLLKMGDKGEDVELYFNRESHEAERLGLSEKIAALGAARELAIVWRGLYTLTPGSDNTMQLAFEPHE